MAGIRAVNALTHCCRTTHCCRCAADKYEVELPKKKEGNTHACLPRGGFLFGYPMDGFLGNKGAPNWGASLLVSWRNPGPLVPGARCCCLATFGDCHLLKMFHLPLLGCTGNLSPGSICCQYCGIRDPLEREKQLCEAMHRSLIHRMMSFEGLINEPQVGSIRSLQSTEPFCITATSHAPRVTEEENKNGSAGYTFRQRIPAPLPHIINQSRDPLTATELL